METFVMKNPWMSAWLSAANTMTSASRGQMAAEMSRQQTAMLKAWTDASSEFWRAAMTAWLPGGTQRRK
jgi:hypothetical protein